MFSKGWLHYSWECMHAALHFPCGTWSGFCFQLVSQGKQHLCWHPSNVSLRYKHPPFKGPSMVYQAQGHSLILGNPGTSLICKLPVSMVQANKLAYHFHQFISIGQAFGMAHLHKAGVFRCQPCSLCWQQPSNPLHE